jgi:hypothetical protein
MKNNNNHTFITKTYYCFKQISEDGIIKNVGYSSCFGSCLTESFESEEEALKAFDRQFATTPSYSHIILLKFVERRMEF